MYHAACKVEFQPFTRSYSQLTFFNFFQLFIKTFYRIHPFIAFFIHYRHDTLTLRRGVL